MNAKRVIAGLLAIFMIATQVPEAKITAMAAEDFSVEEQLQDETVEEQQEESEIELGDGHEHEHCHDENCEIHNDSSQGDSGENGYQNDGNDGLRSVEEEQISSDEEEEDVNQSAGDEALNADEDLLGGDSNILSSDQTNKAMTGEGAQAEKVLPTYTITYHLNGSENSPENPNTYTSEDYIILADPVSDRVGFVFEGWYKENTYKTKVTEIKAGSKGDLQLFAKWSTGSFKVNYDPNGGTGKMTPDTFKYGVEKTLKANAFKKSEKKTVNGKKITKSYVFAGWSVEPVQDYDPEEEYFVNKERIDSNSILAMMLDKDIISDVDDSYTFEEGEVTLYAVWRCDYTVAFNSMGGEELEDITYAYGDTVKLPTPVREGYVFAGWFTDETYRTKVASIAKTAATDYVLVAKWTPIKYTVVFNKNAKDATGSMASLTFVYNKEKNLTANKFVRKGYRFAGWSTVADGNGELFFEDTQAAFNLTAKSNAKVTLYAQWEKSGYTITFVTKGGDPVDAIYYEYSATSATIFDATTYKDRYTFTGWYYDAACKKPVKKNTIPKGTSGDITLYAGWKLNAEVDTFQITYHVDGDEVDFGDDFAQYQLSKAAAKKLPVPEKAGYIFAGWYRDSALKNKLGTSIPKNTKGDLNLYAKWTGRSYKVTFVANAPQGTKASGKMAVQTFSYGTAKALAKSSFAVKGYKFMGWSEEAEGEVLFKNQQKIRGSEFEQGDEGASARTLYAVWEKAVYNITYVDPAGAVNSNPVSYTVDDAITLTAPTQMGNTFQGWYLDKNFKKKATAIPAGSTGNKIFYAKWYTMQKVSALHFVHRYDQGVVTKAATCAKTGTIKYTCETCGKSKTGNLPALGHSYEWIVTKAATATAQGKEEYKCQVCGVVNKTRSIDKIACVHDWDEGVVSIQTKCNKEGTRKYTCTICGETRLESIPMIEHEFKFYKETLGDCVTDGRITYKCQGCGRFSYETIHAPGHDYQWKTTKAATRETTGLEEYTCTRCGVTDGKRTIAKLTCSHDWNEGELVRATGCLAEGITKFTCKSCGETRFEYTEPIGHNFVENKRTEATCTKTGKIEYKCTNCNVTKSEVLPIREHNINENSYSLITKKPNCTEAGVRNVWCDDCDYCTTMAIPANGQHDYAGEEVVEQAGCETEGLSRFTCAVCGQTKEEVIPAIGHTTATRTVTAATYTEEGVGETYCKNCNEVFGTTIIPKKNCDHPSGYSEKKLISSATCTEYAVYRVTCSRCGEVTNSKFTDVEGGYKPHAYCESVINVNAQGKEISTRVCEDCGYTSVTEIEGHTHEYYEKVIKEPTCQETGIAKKTCAICGEQEETDITLSTTAHKSSVGYVVVKQATCAEQGRKEERCDGCGMLIRAKAIIQTSHKYAWVTVTEATTSSEGKEEYTCKDCGKVYKSRAIPVIDNGCSHTGSWTMEVITPATCVKAAHYRVTCSDCSALIDADYTDGVLSAENHMEFTSKITKEPTCVEKGVKTYTCTACGYSYSEVIPKLKCNHVMQYPKEIDGELYYACQTCDKVFEKIPTANCLHYYGYKYVERVKATSDTWGYVDRVCINCKAVVDTLEVHPYSEYHVTDGNGNDVTLYGWFDNDYSKEVFRLTNERRKENELNVLTYNYSCQEASNQRAIEIVVNWSHSRPDGSSFRTITSKWTYAGENIANGYRTPDDVITGWMNSPGHKTNILWGIGYNYSKQLAETQTPYHGLSVGCFHNFTFDGFNPYVPSERIYWVQNFTINEMH